MNYKSKYLKYKLKYLKTKQLYGGMPKYNPNKNEEQTTTKLSSMFSHLRLVPPAPEAPPLAPEAPPPAPQALPPAPQAPPPAPQAPPQELPELFINDQDLKLNTFDSNPGPRPNLGTRYNYPEIDYLEYASDDDTRTAAKEFISNYKIFFPTQINMQMY